jgi:UDP:flavonoid glycosyltransferase YjiC (YdhE family)
MRVLCSTQSVRSHAHSLMPLALALRDAGHDVAFASGPRLESLVRSLGFDFLPCGIDAPRGDDQLLSLPGQAALRGSPLVVRQLSAFASGLGPPFLRDLLRLGRAWQPDVIVREPVEFASALAAERWGIPYASIMWAIYIDPRHLMRDAFAMLCREQGFDPDGVLDGFDRHLVVRYLPGSWRMEASPGPADALACRARPFDGVHAVAARHLPVMTERPLVWVTLGISFARRSDLYQRLLDALSGVEAEAVLTVGDEVTPEEVHAPSNVRVERYIPAGSLLPSCDAVVFHGGFNTLHAALWHGLPMVVVPQEAGDQGPTAAEVERLGLGVNVPGPRLDPGELRRAIERVLREPAFRDASNDFRTEMEALPPLEAAVTRLADLAGAA